MPSARRLALLAATPLALLAAPAAAAPLAEWSGGSGNFQAPGRWSPGGRPSDTAIFRDAGGTTNLLHSVDFGTMNRWSFTAGGNYWFSNPNGVFAGAGIVNTGGGTVSIVFGTGDAVEFRNGAASGAGTLFGDVGPGTLRFRDAAVGAGTRVDFAHGTALDLTAMTTGLTLGSLSTDGPVRLGAHDLILANAGAASVLGSAITGPGRVVVGSGHRLSVAAGGALGALTTNRGALHFSGLAGTTTVLTGSITGPDGGPAAALNLDGGTVRLRGALSGQAITIAGGAALEVGPGGTVTGGSIANLAGQLVMDLGAGGVLTLATPISGAGGLAVRSGHVTLAGSNTHAGGTSVAAGATLQLGDGTAGDLAGPVQNEGTLRFGRAGPSEHAGSITGAGRVQVAAGSAVSLLGAALGWTGGTEIAAGGSLRVAATTFPAAGDVALAGGALLLDPGAGNALTLPVGIAGTGSLRVGSGTARLRSSAAHAGPTAVDSGAVLEIGPGGSLPGSDVALAGTLRFDTTGPTALGGVLSAGGTLAVASGRVDLSAPAHAFTGDVRVSGGALLVNGDLGATASVEVGADGTLGGAGTVGPTRLLAGGTLSPGNSPGTLAVRGDLVLEAGSATVAEVQGPLADRINVSGLATLGGTLRVVPLGGAYDFNRPYVLLAAGGIAGNFAAVDAGDFGVGVEPTVATGTNEVQLVLLARALLPLVTPPAPPPVVPPVAVPAVAVPAVAVPAVAVPAVAVPAVAVSVVGPPVVILAAAPAPLARPAPANPRAVAGALDAARLAGAELSPFFRVYDQTLAALPGALNQLSGELATALPALGFAAGGAFVRTLLSLPHRAGPERLRAASGRLSVWGEATGGAERHGGDAARGSAARSGTTSGFVLGLDASLGGGALGGGALGGGTQGGGTLGEGASGARSHAGVAVSAGEARARLDGGLGRADATVGQVGLHAGAALPTRLGSFSFAAAGGVAFLDAKTRRRQPVLGGAEQRGEADLRVWLLRAEARHEGIGRDGVRLGPFAALEAQAARTEAFDERPVAGGPATGVRAAVGQGARQRAELGLELLARGTVAGRGTRGTLRAGWGRHGRRDAEAAVALALLPAQGFTVGGARPDRDVALVAAGLEVALAPGWSLGARLDGEFGAATRAAGGAARLRYAF